MRGLFGVLALAAAAAVLQAGSLGCSSSKGNCTTDGFGSSSGGSSGGCAGSSSGSSGGSSSGSTVACGVDLKSAACATCVQSDCCSVTQTCANDSACAAAVDCISGCAGDSTCENNCVTGASSSVQSELTAMANCWTTSCAGPCGSGSSSGGGSSSGSSSGGAACAAPGGACTATSQCCQTGSQTPMGAVCIAADHACHAACTSTTQCSTCCAELQGQSTGVCDSNTAGTDTCLP